jgi:P-type Cu+ transporter
VRAAGPAVDPLPCSGCGTMLDPLRAGHVAIFDAQLHYFCNASSCRAAYLAPWGDPAPPAEVPRPPRETAPAPLAAPIEDAHDPIVPEADLPSPLRLDDSRALVEQIDRSRVVEPPSPRFDPEPRDVGGLLLLLAVASGTLAVLLGITGESRLVLVARVVLSGVGASVLVARALTVPRSPVDPHPLPVLLGPVGAVIVAGWTIVAAPPFIAAEAASLAGAIATITATTTWLLEVARRAVDDERAWVEQTLELTGTRLHPDGTEERDAPDLCAGERVVVAEGEDVPVDLVIHEGEAEVLPWLRSNAPVRRRPGDTLVAGAHVVSGRVVGVCTWAGRDRAFARVLLDPRRRADALASVPRAARSLVERWGVVTALGAAALYIGINRGRPDVAFDAAMVAVAVLSGLSTSIIGVLGGVQIARGLQLAQRRGITYRSADAWERAAHATVTVFCARGTLLLGEPEVAEVEVKSQQITPEDLLALASGAARSDTSPVALAILRAAKNRGIKPGAVRNPTVYPGMGVNAITSAGEEIILGSRAHMLAQRIGIAGSEWRIGELSALGRSVVLVAVGGRLVGLVGLQDGIRTGARASVQHLLDVQIEPVLLSADAQDTCDAIAHSLDIEHVRAEVPNGERAEEVRKLSEAGEAVAVIGHPGVDDVALGAAGVSIALGAAGSASREYDVALASDDLRDAALALALARRSRIEARVSFGLSALPPVLGVGVVALGVLPASFVPIAALLGGIVGVLHSRQVGGDTRV